MPLVLSGRPRNARRRPRRPDREDAPPPTAIEEAACASSHAEPAPRAHSECCARARGRRPPRGGFVVFSRSRAQTSAAVAPRFGRSGRSGRARRAASRRGTRRRRRGRRAQLRAIEEGRRRAVGRARRGVRRRGRDDRHRDAEHRRDAGDGRVAGSSAPRTVSWSRSPAASAPASSGVAVSRQRSVRAACA